MRWNSTFQMLDFAVDYRKPLDLLSADRGNGLREYELKEEEWKLAAHLRDALKVRGTLSQRQHYLIFPHAQIFQDATLFFSRGSPDLATVIPVMDHIDQVLTSQSANHIYEAPIRVALIMGKKTLNRYYTLTDSSEVYRIAMSV
jgi:hypothetical protein